ncbi:hypothetical protein ONZ45_g7595 [Pleurotus djamor]|nr:hypothetical protein ONZ45_g7595 [Pleurotus djamor]
MSIHPIDFRKLDLPIGLVEPKFSFSSTLLLLHRCRFIILFYTLWSTFLYLCFVDVVTWDLREHPVISVYLPIAFLVFWFTRVFDSYYRVDQSIYAWKSISKYMASLADSAQFDSLSEDDDEEVQEQEKALRYLEQLAIALRLYDPNPQRRTSYQCDKHKLLEERLEVQEKGEVEYEVLMPQPSASSSQEGPILPSPESKSTVDLPTYLCFLQPYIPKIPSRLATQTPGGPDADIVRIPHLLSRDLVSFFFSTIVAADDNDFMLNPLNMPCGYTYALPEILGVLYSDFRHKLITDINNLTSFLAHISTSLAHFTTNTITTCRTITTFGNPPRFLDHKFEFLEYQLLDYVVMGLPAPFVPGSWRKRSVRRRRNQNRNREEREEEDLNLDYLFRMA